MNCVCVESVRILRKLIFMLLYNNNEKKRKKLAFDDINKRK